MKKSNVIIQAAIASALFAMVGSAQATTVSTVATSPIFAKELLQGSTPNATALTIPAAQAIVVTSNVSIPANSTVYVYVKLNGASISTIPSVIPAAALTAATIRHSDGTGAAAAGATQTLTALDLGTTTGTANPTAVGAGVDYVVFQVNTNTSVVGVGGELCRIGVAVPLAVNNATALLTAPLTATASVGVGAPTSRFGALPAAASSHDATSAATSFATAVQGITLTATANTNAGKIDLTATPVASQFTTTGTSAAVSTILANLGSLTATNVASVQADGATAYTMANMAGATGLNATVAAPAGFFAALGTTGKMELDSSAICANAGGSNGMTSTAFTTAGLALAATSVAIPSTALPISTTPYYLCMRLPAHTTTSVALLEGTPTIAATITHTATTVDSNTSVTATSMFALVKNGSTSYVRNYVPAAVTGFVEIVRISNTGAIAAPVTITMNSESGAQIGSAYTTASLAAGATIRLTQAVIEAGVGGTLASTDRPRLTVTAPTNGMDVQSIMFSNGVYTNLSGTE